MSIKYKVSSIKVLLLLIIILAALLRIWGIAQIPAGLNADEAAIGYNAYSLIHTGKDEYGSWFPLAFKSFGDYKPGLYFYMVMPFVATLGLNELAVRVPSALFGIGNVLLIYFLAKEIFKKEWVGLGCAFLLAITPWSVEFSRGSWETNAATFFISLGVLLWIRAVGGIRGIRVWEIFWSLVCFLVAMYTYQSPRLVVPVLVVGLVVLYSKPVIREIGGIRVIGRKFWLPFVLLVLLSIPLAFQFVGGGASARFNGLSFLSDPGPENRLNQLRGEHTNPGSIVAKVFHNKLTAYIPQFIGHYVDHFKGDFLFINGDPIIRNKVPETGQFYLIEGLFLVVGFILLFRSKSEHKWLIVVWLLVSPLASSMTYQTPNAVRALTMVVPYVLLMGLGMIGVIGMIRGIKGRAVIAGVLLLVLSFETGHFLEEYFIHYPKRYPQAWEYGFREMVVKLENLEGNYQKIVITDKYDQPYILTLFYRVDLSQQGGKPFNLADYQGKLVLSERDKFNFGTVRNIGNYEFHEVKGEDIKGAKNILFVLPSKDGLPPDAKILDEVKYPNGQDAFVFVGT